MHLGYYFIISFIKNLSWYPKYYCIKIQHYGQKKAVEAIQTSAQVQSSKKTIDGTYIKEAKC